MSAGLCWKQLSQQERERWEAEAVVAQTEHRARYPDWRFRPGANALAKLKVSEAGTSSARRRSVRSRTKDPPLDDGDEEEDSVITDGKGKAKDKGKAKAKSSRMLSLEETRCAKIAGFVAEGIKGEELEVAVKQWEGDRRITKPPTRTTRSRASKSKASSSTSSHSRSQSDASLPGPVASSSTKPMLDHSSNETTPTHIQTSRTPTLDTNKPGALESNNNSDTTHPTIALSEVPLTHMFKRSLSVPASSIRTPQSHPSSSPSDDSSAEEFSPTSAEPSPGTWGTFKPLILPEAPTRTHMSTHDRRDTISFPMPSSSSTSTFHSPHLTWQEAENQRRTEEMRTPDPWWSQRSPPADPHYSFEERREAERDGEDTGAFSTDNMGYESQSRNQYDRGYMEVRSRSHPASTHG